MRFKRSIKNDIASQMDAQFGTPRNKGAEAINQLMARVATKAFVNNPRVRSRLQPLGYALDPNTGMLVRPNSMTNKARGTGSSAIYNPATGQF
jgi:hypothetical protein